MNEDRRRVWEKLSADALAELLRGPSAMALTTERLSADADRHYGRMPDRARQDTSWSEVRRALKEARAADLCETAGRIADEMIAQHGLRFDTYREADASDETPQPPADEAEEDDA